MTNEADKPTPAPSKGRPYTGPLDLFRAGILLARGEMTYDEVLAGINDGTVEVPQVTKKPDDLDWDEIEEYAEPAPFASNRTGDNAITNAQYVELTQAISKARDVPEDQWIQE